LFDLCNRTRRSGQLATLSLLCVLLIAFAGSVQATHVHIDQPDSANHECSVCSVAHAGVLPYIGASPVPIIFESAVVSREEVSPKALLLASFLYIRPPPVS